MIGFAEAKIQNTELASIVQPVYSVNSNKVISCCQSLFYDC